MIAPHRRILGTACLLAVALLVLTMPDAADRQLPAQQKNAGEFDALRAALVLEKTLVKVIEDAEKSVVAIARVERDRAVKRRKPFEIFRGNNGRSDPNSPDFVPNDFGSGIIIAPDGKNRLVLTNYHVVKGGPVAKRAQERSKYELYVRLSNRRAYAARIVAADPRSDLAVLSIDFDALKMKPAEVSPLKIGSRNKFRKGQLVVALGNPYAQARDGSACASWGMISNISRKPKPAGKVDDLETRKKESLHHLGTLLHVDTRLGIGFSGGALLNLKGELIGITTSLAALEGYESSVGYAVPLDAAMRRIVSTLAKGREVEYGYLGVQPKDVDGGLPVRLKRRRATSVVVHGRSPAASAGIRSDDIILAVNGTPVHDRYDLMLLVGRMAPESQPRLHIWRSSDKRELMLDVSLGKWPVLNADEIIATNPRYPDWRGMAVDYPTGRFKYLQQPYRYQQAVVVLRVTNPALKKNGTLRPGDFVTHINGTLVQTPRAFYAIAGKLKGPAVLTLESGRRIRVAP